MEKMVVKVKERLDKNWSASSGQHQIVARVNIGQGEALILFKTLSCSSRKSWN